MSLQLRVGLVHKLNVIRDPNKHKLFIIPQDKVL